MTFFYLIPVNRNFTITQLSIFPEPSIPTFQFVSEALLFTEKTHG